MIFIMKYSGEFFKAAFCLVNKYDSRSPVVYPLHLCRKKKVFRVSATQQRDVYFITNWFLILFALFFQDI
jgi:hypothetical protein